MRSTNTVYLLHFDRPSSPDHIHFLRDLLTHDPECVWQFSLAISMMLMGIGYLLLATTSNETLLVLSLLSTTMVLGVAAVLPVLCPDALGIQRSTLRRCYV